MGLQARVTMPSSFFVSLVEMGFHHVDQDGIEEMEFYHVDRAGLKLLISSDLPSLASQSVGITGVSHHTWPQAQSLLLLFGFINIVI